MSSAMRLLSAYVFMAVQNQLWFDLLSKTNQVLVGAVARLFCIQDVYFSTQGLLTLNISKFVRESGDILSNWAMVASSHIPCNFYWLIIYPSPKL
jgi:hypothetical protein